MQLCKVQLERGEIRTGVLEKDSVRFFRARPDGTLPRLCDILHADDPVGQSQASLGDECVAVSAVTFRAPLDNQEVWAAGVTYTRSREARERESVGAAQFYDLVYKAARPELFFKATPRRVAHPGGRVRVRKDSRWSVPEPEVALVLSPHLHLVGFTIGNDMSARDIEGENPLYLPQAKVYDECCALGPVITLATAMPPPSHVSIRLTIQRGGKAAFEGTTSVAAMARSFDDLIGWLGRDSSFPDGVVLLTGTGIVPPDQFSLAEGDVVHIDVSGIGRLSNTVGIGG